MSEIKIFFMKENDANRRIDRILRKFLNDIPLSGIYTALRTKRIKVNGKKVNPSYTTEFGDKIEIENTVLSSAINNTIKKSNLSKKNTCSISNKIIAKNSKQTSQLDIILKTSDLLFLNKHIGQTVHGENSLCSSVFYNQPQNDSMSFKVGPLHRLDKNTSGIITFSQSLIGAQKFSEAIQTKNIEKYYIGVIEGTKIPNELKSNVDGKPALTFAEIIANSKTENISLVKFQLITGRKHQIRIHCAKCGSPLLNDIKYNATQKFAHTKHYFLHAYKLQFKKVIFNDLPATIIASFPAHFKKLEPIFGINFEEFLRET